MQTTTNLYKQIVASDDHYFETKISLAGHELAESQIVSLERDAQTMAQAKPSVGGALSGTLSLTVLAQSFTIPRMAEIDVYVRARNSTSTSEWLPAGVFFIDTRDHDQTVNGVGVLKITAFDAMMKAEADYPDSSLDWPALDTAIVAEIASAIGVTVDARTNSFLTATYKFDLPIVYTMRETLGHIAAAYGGNFVITAENKLLFVPLYGLDPDVSGSYLADENGNALVFGNERWCILV